ncbi:MAG: hypothetical protein ACOCV1_04405 [Bacillota bacterium]
MEKQTQENIKVESQDNKKNLEKGFKWIGIVIFIFGIFFTFLYAYYTEDFSYGWVIFILITLSIIVFILIFFFKIKEKFGNLSKKVQENINIPEPVGPEYLKEHLYDKALKNKMYMNEVKAVEDTDLKHVGNDKMGYNLIYCFKIRTLYKNEEGENTCYVIYNANYPKMDPVIYFGKNPKELGKKIKGMSRVKEEDSPEETSRSYNPVLNTYTEYHKKGTTYEKNKNKTKGDLE